MTLVKLTPHPDKSTPQWMNLPAFLVLRSPYLPWFRTHSPPQWGWHSPAQTSLVLSKKMQLQGSKPGGTSTTIPLALGTEKVQKKIQVNCTERYRTCIQTLFFWDMIHLCNRGGISQTLLRPEITDSHAEIIAICTIIMWLAWFWGPKPQLTAGKKGEGGE